MTTRPSCQVREGYGTTECVTASCLTPPKMFKEGSIGIPFPDTYYQDRQARHRRGGALRRRRARSCLAGPTVMLELHEPPRGDRQDPAAITRTASSGSTPAIWASWTRRASSTSGSRVKRMIVTSGYNVYPGQIENILDASDMVQMSAASSASPTPTGCRRSRPS